MRRGLIKEVRQAFALAIDMVGCWDPDIIDAERYRLRGLEKEVLVFLRGQARAERWANALVKGAYSELSVAEKKKVRKPLRGSK